MVIKYLPTKTLIIGLFLLIWSVNAYIIVGNLGKYLSLFGGFSILFLLYFVNKKIGHKDVSFFLKSLLFYSLYLSIAVIQSQNLDKTGFVFSFICFALLNIGFYIGSNNLFTIKLTKSHFIIFCLLSLFGALTFYRKQASTFKTVVSDVGRGTGDDFLNPNGVAYTESLVFIFLFWLLFQIKNKNIRILAIISIIAVLLIIFMTSARGATLSLLLFIIYFYYKGIKNSKKVVQSFLKYFFTSAIIISAFVLLAKNIPFINSKLEFLTDRFISLIDFFSEKDYDYSIDDRTEMYNHFYKNWQEYLLGKEDYIGYPHNIYVEIFMRWGLFGLPLIFIITKYFFKSLKLISRNILESQYSIVFLLASLFFFSFLQSLTSLNLEMNRSLWLSLGFLIGFFSNKTIKV